jgi:predicted transcriptional regulator
LKIIRVFEGLWKERVPGPFPSFSEHHFVKAIEVIGDEGPVGRIRLSEVLRLGEGATRTLIKRLKGVGLIKISKLGIELSPSGRKLLDELRSKIVQSATVSKNPLTVGTYNVGILIRDSAHKVRYGVEQRDAAIKIGAKGATVLIFKDGRLSAPALSNNVARDWPKVAKQILEVFHPKENDVIVIGGAETKGEAEDGARAAALILLGDD